MVQRVKQEGGPPLSEPKAFGQNGLPEIDRPPDEIMS